MYATHPDFENLTKQQLFDKSYQHTMTHGASLDSVDSSPTYDGCGCSAGVHIGNMDMVRDAGLMKQSWGILVQHDLAPVKYLQLMHKIQQAHDQASSVAQDRDLPTAFNCEWDPVTVEDLPEDQAFRVIFHSFMSQVAEEFDLEQPSTDKVPAQA